LVRETVENIGVLIANVSSFALGFGTSAA